MRHRVKSRKLSRTASHRKALMRNLASSLILHKRIRTTTAKAKELRGFIEPLITKARKGGLHNTRMVIDALKRREASTELLGAVVEAVGDRQGGYTRVIKIGQRPGDGAEMSMIEFVDFNESTTQRDLSRKEAKEVVDETPEEEAVEEQVEDAQVIEETEEAPKAEEEAEPKAEETAEAAAEETTDEAAEPKEEAEAPEEKADDSEKEEEKK